MGREEQIVNERIRKLQALKDSGVDPYPATFDKKHTIEQCLHMKLGARVKTAGRLITKRELGKIAFARLRDGFGEIQIVLQEKKTPEKTKTFFKKCIDSGDFVGIVGTTIKTKTGEKSILVKEVVILAKSILPLPEKFHGLKDEEERFRKRYLELITNPALKELFVKKATFWRVMREFLLTKGFIEVETPVLEACAGGAAATPFQTKHHALDMDLYLRISMGELWQKRLMVAGYDKTFEIGRQFRNEGIDSEHLQDYTQMEFYWAYAHYKDGMKLVEALYKKVAQETIGSLKFQTRSHTVDLGKKWKLYDFEKTLKEKTGVSMYGASKETVAKKLKTYKVAFNPKSDKWKLVDLLWKVVRKKLTGPGFLINHPIALSPLAKKTSEDPRKVERFQVIIAGSELGNGYSELNDPFDQEKRFIEQRALRDSGDAEAHVHDKEFVEALKYGMPPTCGFGLSERYFAFLVDKPVRETVFFPLLRVGK